MDIFLRYKHLCEKYHKDIDSIIKSIVMKYYVSNLDLDKLSYDKDFFYSFSSNVVFMELAEIQFDYNIHIESVRNQMVYNTGEIIVDAIDCDSYEYDDCYIDDSDLFCDEEIPYVTEEEIIAINAEMQNRYNEIAKLPEANTEFEYYVMDRYVSGKISKVTFDTIIEALNDSKEYCIKIGKDNKSSKIDGENICYNLFCYVKSKVLERINTKYKKHFNKGSYISFDECDYVNRINNAYEFCVDGRWGLVNSCHKVILKNSYRNQFSTLSKCSQKSSQLVVLTDIDTELKGLYSLKDYNFIIPAVYDSIIPVNDVLSKNTLLQFFVVSRGEINELFDTNGDFKVGGFSKFEIDNGYYKFYFNLRNSNYSEAFCAVVDRNFLFLTSPKRCVKLRKCQHDVSTLFDIYPESVFLRNKVDLSLIDRGYIILKNPDCQKFFISEYVEGNTLRKRYVDYCLQYFLLPYSDATFDMYCKITYGMIPFHDPINDSTINNAYIESVWEDKLIEDDYNAIIKINYDSGVEWAEIINDFDLNENFEIVIYKDGKVGFGESEGIRMTNYDGICSIAHIAAVKKNNINPDDASTLDDYVFYRIEGNNVYQISYNEEPLMTELGWFPKSFDQTIQCVHNLKIAIDDDYCDDNYYSYSRNYQDCGWSKEDLEEACDIAYEGYSPLELGLD